jgi:hypothetical protein
MGRVPSLGGTIWLIVLALLWMGCSHPATERSENSRTEAAQQRDPLRQADSAAADSHPQPVATAGGAAPGSDVPFADPQSLPAGTMLTVRLTTPVSSDSPRASGTFVAVVDEPVVVEGTTLVPRGAQAAGRIEAARPSTVNRNQGYVRLTLDVVDVAGWDLPIRTSSLFARGKAGDSPAGEGPTMVSLEPGRRLTFRLTDAVDVFRPSPDLHR